MNDISKPITENALQENLVELSQRNEQTHLQIQTLNEMVGRLRKENAKLQAERDEWRRVAEYDKLREYANILAKSAMMYGPCDWCPYKDDEDACDCDTLPMRDGCKFNDELRELGVKAR